MLKEMTQVAKKHLVTIFNKFWKEAYFPEKWREATVIAFPKSEKDHSKAEIYRPIALTSCLSKTLERMINTRLYDYLEMNKELANIQNGGRRRRSTMDHLVRLETKIRSSYAHDQIFILVFFDLKKAYDTAWKYGIMRDLYRMRLGGRLPLYIREFLSKRRFRVKVEDSYSDVYSQEEGVPQGSVLSATLFNIKINQLQQSLPQNNLCIHLYVDDLQVGYSHIDEGIIQDKLQDCINRITEWTGSNGFVFSMDKTKAVLFTQRPGVQPRPDLQMYTGV